MRSVLLYSGGFDSACAWYVLGKPDALYVGGEFGPARNANAGEMAAIVKQRGIDPEFSARLRLIRFDFRPLMRPGKYDFPRDLILCQLAWAAGYDHVMIGWVKDDGTTPEWAERQSKNIGRHVGMQGFKVSFPVVSQSKRELYDAALDAGASPEFLHVSHSCLRSSEPCGECKACVQRQSVQGVTIA